MHRSSVVLCLSKPSTSIYLDFCPRDQCFKVAYIVEDCNFTVNPDEARGGSLGTLGGTSGAVVGVGGGVGAVGAEDDTHAGSHVAVAEVTDTNLEPLLKRDVKSEEEASGTLLRASREKLAHLIHEFNSINPPGLDMELEGDGTTFRGFIRVHMNLSRPISILAAPRPTSVYDVIKTDNNKESSLTSFYLPRDTIKALHITSETTTHEVIATILQKFKVVDNPRKFALYERYYESGDTVKVKMRRIGEAEKPLVLALRWSREQECNKMFVLQENETGDILWEAFSLPELGNFLRILDREEEEYKRIVRQKYQNLGKRIQDAMDKIHPPEAKSPSSTEEPIERENSNEA